MSNVTTSRLLTNHIEIAIKGIILGSLQQMVNGALSKTIVTDEFNVLIVKQIATSSELNLLSPPLDKSNDVATLVNDRNNQPNLKIVSNSLTKYGFSGGYAQVSVLKYNSIPGTSNNQTSVDLSVFRITTSSFKTSPLYYITMPFVTPLLKVNDLCSRWFFQC